MTHPPMPIDEALPEVRRAFRDAGAVLLRAPTGAGKTTRVPPALLDLVPDKRVVVLQPRRVAARAAARRIAAERGCALGAEVGYQIRFERKATARTRLLVVTEGVLLRMMQDDPFLENVGAVVLDEFHERSLQSDLALALLQRIRTSVRTDLKLVVMSATLDPGPVARYLGNAPVVESEGRAYPVEIEHVPAGEHLDDAVRSAVLATLDRGGGHVLAFLPGAGEIRSCLAALEGPAKARGVRLLPLHGALPPAMQDEALAPSDTRKVILATNVAETSVTIEGVRFVIDSGLERLPRLDPAVGLERLVTERISRASADQRAGRAGRTAPGVCVRLWAKGQDHLLERRRPPEILRADLAGAALQLYAWGERDLRAFPFFEPPPEAALRAADRLLERLGALASGTLTSTGRQMARLPAHPRLARLLVEARDLGHAESLSLAAAALSDRSPFVPLRRGETVEHASSSDVVDVVEALAAFERTRRLDAGVRTLRRGPARRALEARDQYLRAIRRLPGASREAGPADEALLRAVLAAYPDRVARRRDAQSVAAVLVGGRGARIARESAVRDAPLFVAVDVQDARGGERKEALVRVASAIEHDWLDPSRIRTEEVVQFDAKRRSVGCTRRTLYEDLCLDEVAVQAPRGRAVERVLAGAAAEDLEAALPLDDERVASLRTRAACLRDWRPELDLPDLTDDALRALLPTLARGLRSFAELGKVRLYDHLRGLFAWDAWQTLEREAPERVKVPSGSWIRLRYEVGRPPVLAVRIQEVFGMQATPTVAGGRVKVLMHLLAPNLRPQQITDDMPSFWANTYAGVRAELRRRYPKHAWPEDVSTAEPTRGPRRRPH